MHADDRGSTLGFGAKPRSSRLRQSIFLRQFDASGMRPGLAGENSAAFWISNNPDLKSLLTFMPAWEDN